MGTMGDPEDQEQNDPSPPEDALAWGFAPPAFRAEESFQTLRRQLRELGLNEREGVWEHRGLRVAKAAVAEARIEASRVKRMSRSSPEWQSKTLKSAADVRDFVADLKKHLAQWSASDE